ncbi:MAG: heparan-alpha-glucosaminide N-acetyltransferase domain-containing protein [Cyclobacteriaceae bacterium]
MKERLLSLDVFRGMTVAGMILVNNPGSWSDIYPPLRHAEWHGCTPTDLIFPFFLFIVGTSIHFAYQDKLAEGLTKKVFFKILKRALLIFLIGLFLTLFPKFNFETVRIPGVLQRIAVVFFVASILYLKTNWLTQLRVAVILLVSYYLMMTLIPVPGVGPPSLEAETNLGAWLDRMLLDGHLWVQSKTWDPEGVLSTIPAIATAILGMLTGKLLSGEKTPSEKIVWLFFTGCILIVLGLGWGMVFPINKALWTSSYVLYTGGIAMQFLACCYWLVDVQGFKKWTMPFVYYGVNALFVFVASALLVKSLSRIKITDGENEVSFLRYVYQYGYTTWLSPLNASLLYAITLVLIFLVVLRWMYKKKIFVKI